MTIGVWVGRPDGAPVPGLVGRARRRRSCSTPSPARATAPRRLPPRRRARSLPRTNRLPPPLQRFRADGATVAVSEPPRIMFPPNGARLELSGGAKPDAMPLKIAGGVAPLTVLVNGVPLPARELTPHAVFLARRPRLRAPDGDGRPRRRRQRHGARAVESNCDSNHRAKSESVISESAARLFNVSRIDAHLYGPAANNGDWLTHDARPRYQIAASRRRARAPLALKKKIKFAGIAVGTPVFAFFFPKLTLFYAVCGLYDVTRNRPLDWFVLRQYFLGNGVPTWLLSPFNILLDLLTLPYLNKGVYRLEDLPAPYRAEVERVIEIAKRENLVGQLEARTKELERTMIFFKWYGENVDTFLDTPAFHQRWNYIQTIGVSVFNRKVSTSRHFGPIRPTLRVLYNLNDSDDLRLYRRRRHGELLERQQTVHFRRHADASIVQQFR